MLESEQRGNQSREVSVSFGKHPSSDLELPSDNLGFYFIGDLAERVKINPVTIRFYEREGLLSPRRIGRFRTYCKIEEAKLRRIIEMRNMGFPLVLIKKVLARSNEEAGNEDREFLQKVLSEHLIDLHARASAVQQEITATQTKLESLES